ncbi:hypothetical protein AKJ16_DCAP12329, partial [Drosera capensis]
MNSYRSLMEYVKLTRVISPRSLTRCRECKNVDNHQMILYGSLLRTLIYQVSDNCPQRRRGRSRIVVSCIRGSNPVPAIDEALDDKRMSRGVIELFCPRHPRTASAPGPQHLYTPKNTVLPPQSQNKFN